MEKDQLVSMIHFLVKCVDERAEEIKELKDMMREQRDAHKKTEKRLEAVMETQTKLLKSIDELTR